jgi:hypothetical protein
MKKDTINYDLWNYQNIEQIHNSKKTSINSVNMPKTIKLLEGVFQAGQKWADIGGGRFDNVKNYLNEKNISFHIYDPFNRSQEDNAKAVLAIHSQQCDGVMVNNVLNVIKEKENRKQVISQAYDCLKEHSCAFFLMYEGDKSEDSRITMKGENSSFQLNWPTKKYMEEIKAVFGDNVSISKGLIIAQKKLQLNHDNSVENLIAQSKKIGVPQRSNVFKVGKTMGHNLYIHKNYSDILPDNYQDSLAILTEHAPTFEFNIIKYNKEEQSYSFIFSPDFDVSDEPIVGDIIRISASGDIKYLKQKSDPQIYHHKWNFVKDDYTGFNVIESIERSISWKSKLGQNKEISSRIGTKSFWDKLNK